jgi:hypothetical protein
MNWEQVAKMLQKYLRKNLGDQIIFQHTEFMGTDWFEDTATQIIMEKENLNFPFVLVNGELASAGKKINISKVLRKAQVIIIKTS